LVEKIYGKNAQVTKVVFVEKLSRERMMSKDQKGKIKG